MRARPATERARLPPGVCVASCGDPLAEMLGDAQPGTARARIGRNCLLLRLNRLADELELGTRARRHLWQPGVHGIGERMAAHELLHHAVLERMKTDDGEPALRRQAFECSFEPGLELGEL